MNNRAFGNCPVYRGWVAVQWMLAMTVFCLVTRHAGGLDSFFLGEDDESVNGDLLGEDLLRQYSQDHKDKGEDRDSPDDNAKKEDDPEKRWRLFQGKGTFKLPFTAHAEADISEPGPDTADFPNSPYTVPPGVVYVETGFTYSEFFDFREKGRNFAIVQTIRAGLWSDLEMRVEGAPFVWQFDPKPQTSGLSPLAFGFKKNMWKEDKDGWRPGFGVQAGCVAPMGNPRFNTGWAFPYLDFNFEKSFPKEVEVAVTLTPFWTLNRKGDPFVDTQLQWSVNKKFESLKRVQFFQEGYIGIPATTGIENDLVLGWGAIWFAGKRAAIDGSYMLGVTRDVPKNGFRVGLDLAF